MDGKWKGMQPCVSVCNSSEGWNKVKGVWRAGKGNQQERGGVWVLLRLTDCRFMNGTNYILSISLRHSHVACTCVRAHTHTLLLYPLRSLYGAEGKSDAKCRWKQTAKKRGFLMGHNLRCWFTDWKLCPANTICSDVITTHHAASLKTLRLIQYAAACIYY